MRSGYGQVWIVASALGLLTLALPGTAQAQDESVRIVPPGWSVGHVRVRGRGAKPPAAKRAEVERRGPTYRGLTINRGFASPQDDDDPFAGGITRYGDIRSFDPVPTITSGTQLPYGLDGIGGYGSDVGFSAAQDSAVYDRGQ